MGSITRITWMSGRPLIGMTERSRFVGRRRRALGPHPLCEPV